MIKVNDIVDVYIDPYTKNIFEGKAQIIKVLGFHKYEIKFIRMYEPDKELFNFEYEGEILTRTIIE